MNINRKLVEGLSSETYKRDSLRDIMFEDQLSANSLIDMLDKYMSSAEIDDFANYVKHELGTDTITEDLDVSPDNLLSKVNTSDLKNMVKSAGVQLKGNESKDELTGMAKALASKQENTKLKRKKGIKSKFIQV